MAVRRRNSPLSREFCGVVKSWTEAGLDRSAARIIDAAS